jgi:hypothetical protein
VLKEKEEDRSTPRNGHLGFALTEAHPAGKDRHKKTNKQKEFQDG